MLVITFLAVLLTRLEYAIFVGIFANIAFFLRSTSKLHVAELEETPGGTFAERNLYDRAGERRVVFLQVEGELFFAIADQLQDRLTDARGPGVRAIVLRLKRCHQIDGTVLDVLERFALDMKEHGGHLLLCGLRPGVLRTMKNYGLDTAVGPGQPVPRRARRVRRGPPGARPRQKPDGLLGRHQRLRIGRRLRVRHLTPCLITRRATHTGRHGPLRWARLWSSH